MSTVRGEPETLARRIAVRNPRTGREDYSFEQPGAAALDAIVERLRAAQPGWAARGAEWRAAQLVALGEAMRARRDALLDSLLADTGRVRESRIEIEATLAGIERWAAQAPALLRPSPPQATRLPSITVTTEPVAYALVGIISPWNFPLLLGLIDAVPALAAGSAVLVKPSEVTPRFAAPLKECIDAVEGLQEVLCVLPGDGALGAALVPRVDVVCFTGSVATGRAVGVAAMRAFVPVHLELGGKDPAIVLAGADLPRAAAAIAWGGLVNAGQSCLSIERVYVEAPAYPAFIEHLVREVRGLKLNHPDPACGEVGPIIARRQIEVISAHLEDARRLGAEVLCGGEIVDLDGGQWCLPTVLGGVSHAMRVMREETFGPVLPVMAVADTEEAIRLANDSEFGLSAAVFAGDPTRARAVARRLEAGAISINDAALTSLVHEGEKHAFKHSGLGGSRMGAASIRRFLRSRCLIENTTGGWDPWWFRPGPR